MLLFFSASKLRARKWGQKENAKSSNFGQAHQTSGSPSSSCSGSNRDAEAPKHTRGFLFEAPFGIKAPCGFKAPLGFKAPCGFKGFKAPCGFKAPFGIKAPFWSPY